MKDIKDYLHLYLGCECRVGNSNLKFNLTAVQSDSKLIVVKGGNDNRRGQFIYPNDIILVLRPLSDMAEEELLNILRTCYKSVYSHSPNFDATKLISDYSGVGIQAFEEGWQYGLTITREKVYFSANGSFLDIPQFEIFAYLLSKHFDLFGLIEAGIAIGKTILK